MGSNKCEGLIVGLIIVVLGLGFVAVPSMATVYTVGDAAGWGQSVDYSTWVNGKTFTVGDSLVFNFGNSHNVAEVSPSDYTACSVGNAVADTSGAATILLSTAGTHYFICGVIGHCSNGMKLAVPVTAAASGGGGGSTTSPPAAPSGGGASQSPPTATNSPPGVAAVPNSSSAGNLSPAVAALFGFVALFFKLVIS